MDDLVALPVLVNELSLEGRTDVQPAAVSDDAALCAVDVSVNDIPDRNLVQFDFHFTPAFCE